MTIHRVKSICIWSFPGPYFLTSDWIWKDTPYLSVFSPNEGKYGPEKLQIRTLFTQWLLLIKLAWTLNYSNARHKEDTWNLKNESSSFRMKDKRHPSLLMWNVIRLIWYTPTGNCMFKLNNRNNRRRWKICSKLTVKTPLSTLNIFHTLL